MNNRIDDFLIWLEKNKGRSVATVNNYSAWLYRLEKYATEKKTDLISLSRRDLEYFTGIWAHDNGLKIASRRPLIAAIRGFYSWLEREKLIYDNPAKYLSYPKSAQPLPQFITLEDLEQILSAIVISESLINARDAAMIALFAGTGIRVSGLCSLNQSNLITQRLDDGTSITMLRVTEKGKKERIVPIPEIVVLYLHAYLGHPKLLEINRYLPNHDQVLFVSLRNTRLSEAEFYGENRRLARSSVNEIIYKRALNAGIPVERAHPHAFRHHYGTTLYDAGTQLLDIKTLMGHENIESTEIYVHLAHSRLFKEVQQNVGINRINTPLNDLKNRLPS